jgi:hypothetical protein
MAELELGEDVRHVVGHRLRGQVQALTDLGMAEAGGDPVENLPFAVGELGNGAAPKTARGSSGMTSFHADVDRGRFIPKVSFGRTSRCRKWSCRGRTAHPRPVPCHEDVEYARRLNEAGVPCEPHTVAGAFHEFHALFAKAAVSRGFWQEQRRALARALDIAKGR